MFSRAFLRAPTQTKLAPLQGSHLTLNALRQPLWQRSRPFGSSNQYQRFGASRHGPQWFWTWVQRPTFYYEVGALGIVVGGYYITNLETVAISGRRRFNVFGERWDEELGEQAKQETLVAYRSRVLSQADPRYSTVHSVLERIIPASGLKDKKWELYVIDEPSEKNAFVLPNGVVFIFTGLLPICAGGNGIATVLAMKLRILLQDIMPKDFRRAS